MRQLICSKCKLLKDISFFSKKSDSKRGFSYLCKDCHNKYTREIHYLKYREKQKAASLKWKRKNKIRVLSTQYKISKEILEKEYKKEGICVICKKNSILVLDHDHITNIFRGFICRNCNSLLGFSNDNINTLKNAIIYLSK